MDPAPSMTVVAAVFNKLAILVLFVAMTIITGGAVITGQFWLASTTSIGVYGIWKMMR